MCCTPPRVRTREPSAAAPRTPRALESPVKAVGSVLVPSSTGAGTGTGPGTGTGTGTW